MQIFIQHDGNESGPYTRDEIFRMLKEGSVSKSTLSREKEGEDWTELGALLSRRTNFFALEQIRQQGVETRPPSITFPDIPQTAPAPLPADAHALSKWRMYGGLTLAAILLVFWLASVFSDRKDPSGSPSNSAQSSDTPAPETLSPAEKSSPRPPPNSATAKNDISHHLEITSPETPAKEEQAEDTVSKGLPVETSKPITLDESNAPSNSNLIEDASPQSEDVQAKALPEQAIAPPKKKSLSSFFKIESVKLLKKPSRDGIGIWDPDFVPCLEVQTTVRENIASAEMLAKIYFYDKDNQLVAKEDRPSPSGRRGTWKLDMPSVFEKGKSSRFFFRVPPQVLEKPWKAIIVFGDRHEAHSICFPTTESDFLLAYDEKDLVHRKNLEAVERRPAMEPLSECVVKTFDIENPKITMLLRPPTGVSDASEVKGILALCVFAENVEWIRNELRKDETSGDYGELFRFANRNKLAILAWGAQSRLWDPFHNDDDIPPKELERLNRRFGYFADAWERGAKTLTARYNLPQKDFLLWGLSKSAQWAHRLCLQKPQYFLAVHVHISSSFGEPRAEAAKVLWCLTTGELDPGYQRSQDFYAKCKKLGFPILYKAAPELAHAQTKGISRLGLEFFQYALNQKAERDMGALKDKISSDKVESQPWGEAFKHPPFYADLLNQEVFTASKVEMIPPSFRVSIPTEEIARQWLDSR